MCYTLNPTPATYAYVRGSCTDPSWNSDARPKFCMRKYHMPLDSCLHCDIPGTSDTFVPALDCHDPTKDAYCCSYGNKGCDCEAENITFPEPRTAVSTFDIFDAKGIPRILKAPIEGHGEYGQIHFSKIFQSIKEANKQRFQHSYRSLQPTTCQ